MISIRVKLTVVLLFLNFSVYANFDFNANCIKAYEEVLSLRLSSARTLIALEKKNNPKNSIPYLLDNYVDYFTIMTSESRSDFERLKNNKSARLIRIEQDDIKSPFYLFAQAEINLQWALTRGRFQEYFASAIEINKAYKYLQENNNKFPNFLPNQKNLGMINALLGSLPGGLKKTMSTFGIEGNTQTGVRMLESLIIKLPKSNYAYFYDEVVFSLSYVKLDILNDTGSYKNILKNTESIDTSSLLRVYMRSYAAMKTGHNAQAIATIVSRPKGNQYETFPYLDYLLGIANMRKLDQDASIYLKTYIQNYKGINYVKDAYLNLAWLALVKGNKSGYQENINLVKLKGYSYHEKDKQALNEANYPISDVSLLKSRLLFDGGYYDKALAAIKNEKVDGFKILRDKIEYCYRLGRIYDEMQEDDIAIKFYQFAINLGRNKKYYFAANSAVRIGTIYEEKKNFPQAKIFYELAVDMKGHDYENSIENKAKEGLKRIN